MGQKDKIALVHRVEVMTLVAFSLSLSIKPSSVLAQIKIEAGNMEMELNRANGTVEDVRIGGRQIPLKENRALVSVRDIKAGKTFYPLLGKIIRSGNRYMLKGEIKELELSATVRFRVRNGILFLDTEFKNLTRSDRALVIATTLDFSGFGFIWQGELYDKVHPDQNVLYGNNLCPISTLVNHSQKWGVTIAIPPNAPVFYDTHFENGTFGLHYFIAITPLTKNFPNCANLKAMVYSVNPTWGFRSGLQKYYAAFPDYYLPRVKKGGLWFNGHDYPYPSDIAFYQVGAIEKEITDYKGSFAKSIQSWRAHDPLAKIPDPPFGIFPYTISGQRQIYGLTDPSLPYDKNDVLYSRSDYEKAMSIFDSWNPDTTVEFQDARNANSFNSVKQLKGMILNSGIYDSSGEYTIVARHYTKRTLTFVLNPNPYLLDDSSRITIGKYTLDYYIPEWLKAMPEVAGIYFDSMGRWGKYLNYRRSQFKYAQYPLSVDREGRAVIPNVNSLYDLIKSGKELLHKEDKLVLANGVAMSGAKLPTGVDDYDASRGTSRFFIASLCDVATCESGVRTRMQNMLLYRTFMGRKPYGIVAYHHPSTLEMEKFFKRGLLTDIFTSMSWSSSNPVDMTNAKVLHQRYLPLMRMLYRAGWEPVTGVTGLSGVYCERYGNPSKGKTFIVVYNPSDSVKNISLTLDKSVFRQHFSKAVNMLGQRTRYQITSGSIDMLLRPGEERVLRVSR